MTHPLLYTNDGLKVAFPTVLHQEEDIIILSVYQDKYLISFFGNYDPWRKKHYRFQDEVPRQMKDDSELEIAYGDTFAKMYVYKLSDNVVLYAAGLDPDEIGAKITTAANQSLAKVNAIKG